MTTAPVRTAPHETGGPRGPLGALHCGIAVICSRRSAAEGRHLARLRRSTAAGERGAEQKRGVLRATMHWALARGGRCSVAAPARRSGWKRWYLPDQRSIRWLAAAVPVHGGRIASRCVPTGGITEAILQRPPCAACGRPRVESGAQRGVG